MNTLLSMTLAALFVALCGRSLRAHPLPYYWGAFALAAATFLLSLTHASAAFPPFVSTWIWPLFFRGGLAGALFLIVMWTGALPNSSRLIRTLMPIRGELSILAGILTLGHNAANGLTYFRMLFLTPSRLPLPTLLAAVCSLAMICIMLPLLITSFRCVRRKMKPLSWKRLQRLAYGFYGLLYIHLCLLYIPLLLAGRNYWLTFLLYTFCFLSYAACRVLKYRCGKRRMARELPAKQLRAVIAAGMLTAAVTGGLYLRVQGNSAPAAAETEAPVQTAAEPAAPPSPTPTPEEREAEPTEAIGNEQEAPAPTASPDPTSAPEQEAIQEIQDGYRDGVYTGTGLGFEGPITVSVTIEDGKIAEVLILEEAEDPEFFEAARDALPASIRNAQSTDVAAISGATYSSYGIMDAVDAALAKAAAP